MTRKELTISDRWLRRTAYVLAAFWVLVTLAWIVAGLLEGSSLREFVDEFGFFVALVAIAFPAMGAVIASRQPRNAVTWVYLAIGSVALSGLMSDYARWGLITRPGSLPGAVFASWLANWIWFPGLGLLLTFSLLVFPDGTLSSRKWKSVAWAAGLGIVVMSANLAAIAWKARGPRGLEMSSTEFDALASPLPGWLVSTGELFFLVGALGALASLFFRYRKSSSQVRQQLKWVMYAGALTIVVFFSVMIAMPEARIPQLLVIPLIPAATAVAILKYRLYDIDVLINRTLVYVALTATLALAYFGLVVVLQRLLAPITPESDIAIAGSTLAVATLFQPARSRIQAFIDHRFYRRKYDAARTLEAFSSQLRDEIDLETLGTQLLAAVHQTMQPAHASLWLREPAKSTGGQ